MDHALPPYLVFLLFPHKKVLLSFQSLNNTNVYSKAYNLGHCTISAVIYSLIHSLSKEEIVSVCKKQSWYSNDIWTSKSRFLSWSLSQCHIHLLKINCTPGTVRCWYKKCLKLNLQWGGWNIHLLRITSSSDKCHISDINRAQWKDITSNSESQKIFRWN